MKTILTPVDFSEVSDDVVNAAVRLARANNARIVLLTVVQPPVFTAEYTAVMENIVEIQAIGERAAANHLKRVQTRLEKENIVAESVQFSGSPVVHIVEQAEKFDADYIVMGSHGHTAFYDLLVGSTTHGVLNRAHCPVVIVPPKERQRSSARAVA
jgi:nucleotide-binding universal stress UspA family protein